MKKLIMICLMLISLSAHSSVTEDFAGIISCTPNGENSSPIILSVTKDGVTTVHNDDFSLAYEATVTNTRYKIFLFKGSKNNRKLSVLVNLSDSMKSILTFIDEIPVQKVVGTIETVPEKFQNITLLQPTTIEADCEYTSSK